MAAWHDELLLFLHFDAREYCSQVSVNIVICIAVGWCYRAIGVPGLVFVLMRGFQNQDNIANLLLFSYLFLFS